MKKVWQFFSRRNVKDFPVKGKDQEVLRVKKGKKTCQADWQRDFLTENGVEMPRDLIQEFGLPLAKKTAAAGERRKYLRVPSQAIHSHQITIFSKDMRSNAAASRDLLLDISGGGLLLATYRQREIGDCLDLQFRIGQEKFNLQGRVKRKNSREHGVEFIDPCSEVVTFFEGLFASSRLNRPGRCP